MFSNVIRLESPFVRSEGEIDQAIDVLGGVLQSIAGWLGLGVIRLQRELLRGA